PRQGKRQSGGIIGFAKENGEGGEMAARKVAISVSGVSPLPAGDFCRRVVVVTGTEEGIDAAALLLEAGQMLALQRLSARQADLHRVDLGAVDDQLVMQVGAGRQAGR